MKLILFLLLIPVFLFAQQPVSNIDKPILIKGVHVIPMDQNTVLKNQDVLISKGKIVSITSTGTNKNSSNTSIIDGRGKYLMPGLAEMHAHIPPVNNLKPMKETVRLFLLHGITTIRGMLGHPLHLQLRNELKSGEMIGPEFYTSGPSFNGNSIKTAADGEKLVRAQKAAGYDFLKLHPGLTPETFAAIAKTANEVKIPFAGHVSFNVGIWAAIDSGYATIDHLDWFVESLVPGIENITEQESGLFGMNIGDQADLKRIDTLVGALKKNNIWVVPTQALAERWMSPERSSSELASSPEMKYMSAGQIEGWTNSKNGMMSSPGYDAQKVKRYIALRRKLIYECNRQGVGLLLGCDAPQVFNVPGISTHQELEYLVAAGLSPYEAIRTGTVNVAKFYGHTYSGILKPGSVSNMILLNSNPLENIKNTQTIAGVMMGSNWLSKEYIDAELKKLEKQ